MKASTPRYKAQLLDAPFRCRHCRGFQASSGIGPSPKRFALLRKERAAITRSVLTWRHAAAPADAGTTSLSGVAQPGAVWQLCFSEP